MGINIVYATDDLYSKLVLVSLKSLFRSNMDIKEIRVYIAGDHISAANKRLLMDLAAKYIGKKGIGRAFSWLGFHGVQGAVASVLGFVHAILFPLFLHKYL